MASASAQVGIASRYRGDRGINYDPDVLLADDFESYTSGATGATLDNEARNGAPHWNRVGHPQNAVIDTARKYAGNKALKIKLPASTTTEYSFALSKYFTPPNDKNQASIGAGENRVFFRWYQMWPTNYAVIGSNHNGVTILGGNDPGTPRHIPPANGSGWFTCVMTHNYGAHIDQVTKIKESVSPYYGHIYAYWPGRAEDHWWPDGTRQYNYTFFSAPNGYPDFVKRPCFLPQRGRWYCYEFMVRINTIGKRDGEVKWWVDGELKGDWPDLFLRGVSSVTGQPYGIDTARIGNGRNTCAIELDKWYDNVVVARKYIGPMTPVPP